MRVRSWPASERARLVAGSQWAMVLTLATTFSRVRADCGLVDAATLAPVPLTGPVASATGAAALV